MFSDLLRVSLLTAQGTVTSRCAAVPMSAADLALAVTHASQEFLFLAASRTVPCWHVSLQHSWHASVPSVASVHPLHPLPSVHSFHVCSSSGCIRCEILVLTDTVALRLAEWYVVEWKVQNVSLPGSFGFEGVSVSKRMCGFVRGVVTPLKGITQWMKSRQFC